MKINGVYTQTGINYETGIIDGNKGISELKTKVGPKEIKFTLPDDTEILKTAKIIKKKLGSITPELHSRIIEQIDSILK